MMMQRVVNRIRTESADLKGLVTVNPSARRAPVVTLIGGGGKTGLMLHWARCLHEAGVPVVTATTTRLSAEPVQGFLPVQPSCPDDAERMVAAWHDRPDILMLTGPFQAASGKWSGVPADWFTPLCRIFPDTVFLVEGDGSAGRSLKGHLPYEPVVPQSTSLVIPVVGLDILGKTLNADSVHRPDVLARITGLRQGQEIGPAAVVAALLGECGYLAKVPDSAAILPFFNKAESLRLQMAGLRLARSVLADGRPRIGAVLVGSVHQRCFVRVS